MLGLPDARGHRAGYSAVAGNEDLSDCCGAPLCAPSADGGGEACCAVACGGGGGAYDDSAADCDACGCADRGTTVLSYVGPGGEYAEETTYRYVGGGAGQFGVLRVPGAGPSCCCVLTAPLLLLLLAACLLLLAPRAATSTTTAPPVAVTSRAPPAMPPTTATPPIECGEGEEAQWTERKREWCCDREGKGCPEPEASSRPPVPPALPAETTTPCPIDCGAGYNDLDPLQWVHGWSAAKKGPRTAARCTAGAARPSCRRRPACLPRVSRRSRRRGTTIATPATTIACAAWRSILVSEEDQMVLRAPPQGLQGRGGCVSPGR
ncbi:unnamed protein product, partial [Prorocentrum cordatum]